MYEIEINGRKFLYEIKHDCSEYDEWSWTEFYEMIKVREKRWSWNKFRLVHTGKMVYEKKILFKIGFDIHDPQYTKKEVRDKIEKKVELLGRAEEIERGEII